MKDLTDIRQPRRTGTLRRAALGVTAAAASLVPALMSTSAASAAGGYWIPTGYITVQVTCNPNNDTYTVSPDFGAQRVTRWQMGAVSAQGQTTGWSQWYTYNFYQSQAQRITGANRIYPQIQVEFIQNGRYFYSVVRLTNFDQQLYGSILTQPSSSCIV